MRIDKDSVPYLRRTNQPNKRSWRHISTSMYFFVGWEEGMLHDKWDLSSLTRSSGIGSLGS